MDVHLHWFFIRSTKRCFIHKKRLRKWESLSIWWFQPMWNIFVKLDHFPWIGLKIKIFETTTWLSYGFPRQVNHPPSIRWNLPQPEVLVTLISSCHHLWWPWTVQRGERSHLSPWKKGWYTFNRPPKRFVLLVHHLPFVGWFSFCEHLPTPHEMPSEKRRCCESLPFVVFGCWTKNREVFPQNGWWK